MLVNPTLHRLAVIPGTRFLEDPLGLPGTVLQDPLEGGRAWSIQWLLAPIPGRRLGGIRAKLTDQYGFVSFINQRDLEVLLGRGQPGQYCKWLGENYVSPTDHDWYGLCCDEDDLRDDLFERECRVREEYKGHQFLPTGLELVRRLHLEHKRDVEELDTLLWDMDPETHRYPDPRLETVDRRWARVERNPLILERL